MALDYEEPHIPPQDPKGGLRLGTRCRWHSLYPVFNSAAVTWECVSVWMCGPRHCLQFSSSQSPGPREPAISETQEREIYAHQSVGDSWVEIALDSQRDFITVMLQGWERLNGWTSSSVQEKSKPGCQMDCVRILRHLEDLGKSQEEQTGSHLL